MYMLSCIFGNVSGLKLEECLLLSSVLLKCLETKTADGYFWVDMNLLSIIPQETYRMFGTKLSFLVENLIHAAA